MKAKLAWALMVGATALAGASAPAEDRGPTTISEIRHESSERSTRIVVDCTGPVAYTYYSPDPLTLVVDIPEVDSSSVPVADQRGHPGGRVHPGHAPTRAATGAASPASRSAWPASCPSRSTRRTRR